MGLGNRVSDKRKEKGLTQKALAAKLEVTAAYVSQIENSRRNPSYSILMKLSYVLDTPTDYFLKTEQSSTKEPSCRFIENAVRFLNHDQRQKVIDYLYQLTGTKKYKDFPILDSPTEYAWHTLNELERGKLPADPYSIAEKLGVDIIFSVKEMKYEAVLYKNAQQPLIILDSTIDYPFRQKFSIAMMIGHMVIPWHLRPFFYRDKDQKSLEQEDRFAIETREFAGELLIPSKELSKDFENIGPDLESFEKIAYKKYGCSMLAIAHKYIDKYSNTVAFLTCKDGKPTRVYNFGLLYKLLDRPGEGSFVLSFMSDPPAEKEYRKGFVDAKSWVNTPPNNLRVYEESMLDPKQGIVVTLLKFSLIR